MATQVLVTGAAGYTGSVLCEHLLDCGYEVVAMDNLMYRQTSLFHLCSNPNFDFVAGDVRDERILAGLVKSADVIIPLAAIVGAPACDRDPLLAESVNLEAVRLLNRLRSPEQLVIFPNTNSGYGSAATDGICTEDTSLTPISVYASTKADAERELLDYPNVITLRLATVFGMSPRMRLDLLVNHFTYEAVTSGYIVIYEKDFKRNYIHIRDVADCYLHCIENAATMVGRPYNAGLENANLSKEELALAIQNQVPGFYIHFSELGEDPDKRNYIVSNQRLSEAGFEASRSLDQGIEELLKGYRMLGPGPLANA
jgi:nucleoside-diphosphate-sugar epimerase